MMESGSGQPNSSDVPECNPKVEVSTVDQPSSAGEPSAPARPPIPSVTAVETAPAAEEAEGVAGNTADDEKEAPSRVVARAAPLVSGLQGGAPKRSPAEQLAVAMQALQWEEQPGPQPAETHLGGSEELQEECVGDFARSEVTGGSAPKGKRGGRRSGDGEGRRRRSGDGEGRRRSGDGVRKSGDNEGRRRRSGDGRRSGESRKSGENSRRSGESRRNSGSTGSMVPESEVEQLPQITDILLARLITSLSDSTLGNPALLLQSLLGFSPDDYNDLLAALSESRLSYVDIIAAYLHNIRVMSEDSGSASAALSGTLTRSLIEQYNNLLMQALKSPKPAMKPGVPAAPIGDMMMRSPMPQGVHPAPKPPPVASGTHEAELPRGPSGLGFGRRSLDSLRQRQNFANVSAPPAPPTPKPVPRPGPRRPYPNGMEAEASSNDGYQPSLSPGFSTALPAVYPATAPQTYAAPPPPGFQPSSPATLMAQQPSPQTLPEQYAAFLNNTRLPAVGIVPGLVPRLVHNPMMSAIPGLDYGAPGLVAGVAGIPVPSDWQQNAQVLGDQQGMGSWPQTQEGAQSTGPSWHGSLPVVQEHEQMDHTSAGYLTG